MGGGRERGGGKELLRGGQRGSGKETAIAVAVAIGNCSSSLMICRGVVMVRNGEKCVEVGGVQRVLILFLIPYPLPPQRFTPGCTRPARECVCRECRSIRDTAFSLPHTPHATQLSHTRSQLLRVSPILLLTLLRAATNT